MGIDATKAIRAANSRAKVAQIRDRRRFKEVPAPTGQTNRFAAASATGTVFPHTVLDWSPSVGETILKDGAHNAKIGGDVAIGHLAGAKIFTLSLEERATCPRDCLHWRSCYGNNMNRARRWRHSLRFELALDKEVRALCVTHDLVLIRLHVLGDFPNFGYLKLWIKLLDDLPNLNVFGFSAWKPDTEIGAGIVRVREELGTRFAVRTSGMTGKWGSFTLDMPTERARIGDAIVCPEQRSAMGDIKPGIHCGNCGACWRGDKPITFIEH